MGAQGGLPALPGSGSSRYSPGPPPAKGCPSFWISGRVRLRGEAVGDPGSRLAPPALGALPAAGTLSCPDPFAHRRSPSAGPVPRLPEPPLPAARPQQQPVPGRGGPGGDAGGAGQRSPAGAGAGPAAVWPPCPVPSHRGAKFKPRAPAERDAAQGPGRAPREPLQPPRRRPPQRPRGSMVSAPGPRPLPRPGAAGLGGGRGSGPLGRRPVLPG